MRIPCLAVAPLLALVALTAAAQDPAADLTAAMKDPPATGLLVTSVAEESQAAGIGLRVGDVVVSYAGTPTPDNEALAARKAEVSDMEGVEIAWMRGGESLAATVAPGTIGFTAMPVEKGRPLDPLPADTGVAFDFSALDAGPVERWFAFHLGDGPKCGYETWRLSKAGNRVFLRSEVAFDGGEQWGAEHMIVTVAMTAEPRPRLIFTRFRNPLTGWSSTVEVRETEEGPRLLSGWTHQGEAAGNAPVAAAEGLVPTYFVETLARLMPREEGACFRFVPLTEGFGRPGLPGAILCRGTEEIDRAGTKLPASRVEWLNLAGGVGSTFWRDDAGEIVRVDWGGAIGILTTRDAALEGVPPELRPVSPR